MKSIFNVVAVAVSTVTSAMAGARSVLEERAASAMMEVVKEAAAGLVASNIVPTVIEFGHELARYQRLGNRLGHAREEAVDHFRAEMKKVGEAHKEAFSSVDREFEAVEAEEKAYRREQRAARRAANKAAAEAQQGEGPEEDEAEVG